jgi:protein transport protein SEC24
LAPEDTYYRDFALDCSRQQITLDLFLFSGSTFVDTATLACMPIYTGGQLFYYPNFKGDRDGEKLYRDIIQNITRETGLEAVLRVRTSKGLKIKGYHGNFFLRSADLLALPTVDADKAIGLEYELAEGELGQNKSVYIQAALLYTTTSGERRIRVFTQCLTVTPHLYELFRNVDNSAMVGLTTKLVVEKAVASKLSDAREAVVNQCVEILAVFRGEVALPSANPANQLTLPDAMRHYPTLLLALIKSFVLKAGVEIKPDDRAAAMIYLR